MLRFDKTQREKIWNQTIMAVENYLEQVPYLPVAAKWNVEQIRAVVETIDFSEKKSPDEAISFAVEALRKFQVHTSHPLYLGRFNPASTTLGIAADALTAAFNPQLAAWSYSPFAVEIENHLVKSFGQKFGYPSDETDGTFTSGGAEANHTALICALTHYFPDFRENGLRSLPAQPTIYVSAESHHSIIKAARFCGIGTNALREIPTNSAWQIDVDSLQNQIAKDRQAGFAPLMVVATAGTTSVGIIDRLAEIAAVARQENIWYHVDAAWGGAVRLVPEFSVHLDGIEAADSITFDAHKWLSIPMGAGIFLTRHSRILSQTCSVSTGYMPKEAEKLDVIDPFAHSLQWSRRFIGLKVFLSLAVAGWDGYAEMIREAIKVGDYLRQRLENEGWNVINRTPLPVICFTDGIGLKNPMPEYLEQIADYIVASGQSWISITKISPGFSVLRACITNFQTKPEDADLLVETLNDARDRQRAANIINPKCLV